MPPAEVADAIAPEDADAAGNADGVADTQTGADAAEVSENAADVFGPSPAFARFCGERKWQDTLQPAKVGELKGTFVGSIDKLNDATPFKKGTLETMKVIAQQPFYLHAVRIKFTKGSGPVRLRVMKTQGRSYPGPFPKMKDESLDVMPPIEVEVTESDANQWLEFDVHEAGAFLEPTQHYMIVYEHVAQYPSLALESLPADEYSRALLFLPSIIADPLQAYGLADSKNAYNYSMELVGENFCAWQDAEYWFENTHPFGDQSSGQVAVADIDHDGLDDVLLTGSAKFGGVDHAKPLAYLGDGKGHFSQAGYDAFPDATGVSFVLFGDVDNDGDADALGLTYVSRDGDGDGHYVPGDDCNDTDPLVYKGAKEIADNSKDDDCDGVVDPADVTADKDNDGVSTKDGDCDDSRDDVHPKAVEIFDSRDNNCNGIVDEGFTNHMMLNDGKGHFTALANTGVEVQAPTTAAAFSDANADGKLDVYWGNWLLHYPDNPAVQDRYFTGNGDGKFTDMFEAAGLKLKTPYSVYGLTWCDYNNDGAQDIFVGNYHLYPDQLWKNLGLGTFVDVAPLVGLDHDAILAPGDLVNVGLTGGHSYGEDFGDYDNDGDMDVYVCNLSHPRTQPWADPSFFGVNQGAPDFKFANKTKESGFIYDEGDLNAGWGDFDNDGDLDIVIASIYTGHYSRLYRNDGAKGFVDVTFESHSAIHQAGRVLMFDADNDGDLDILFTEGNPAPPHVHLFINKVGNKNHWLEFDLVGKTATRDAAGARVYVKSAGVTQIRDVKVGGGHWNPQVPKRLHFGLGAATQIDEVKVRWVGGATETITGAAADKRFEIVQGSGKAVAK